MSLTSDQMERPSWWRIALRYWKILFGIAVPIALVPFLLDYENKSNLCAYVLLLMILYWIFEPINLYATALIPVALFPLLGISTTDKTCANYMKGTNMMFFGGLIMGIALEYCNLHMRMALKVVIIFGSSIKNLMAGIMLVTMFLSMWINNTATTAMMIPIVDSILIEIYQSSKDNNNNVETIPEKVIDSSDKHNETDESNCIDMLTIEKTTEQLEGEELAKFKIVRKSLLLSIAYSANIGGTATLTGTGTNLVLQEVFMNEFPHSSALTFTSWFIYAFPAALFTVFGAWLILYLMFTRVYKETPETGKIIRQSAKKRYEELGPFTFHEIAVLFHFIVLVLLWFFREPEIYTGWSDLLTDNKQQIKDATPAILIAISMFLIPANFSQFHEKTPPKVIKRVMSWSVLQKNMSWGVMFLLGGGFALAHGTSESGLNDWFAAQLGRVTLQPWLTVIILVFVSASITEMASNVATANVILPVISHLAVSTNVNPLQYLIPVTISISFAFMFPVSTPPNAIVFEYLGINVIEMIKPGIIMNIVAICIQLVFVNTVGRLIFNLGEFPDWANEQNSTQILSTM